MTIVEAILRMRLLSQRDYQAVLSTIEEIYRFQRVEQFPTRILSAIKNAIPCDLATYNEVNPERTKIASISEPAEATARPGVQEILQQHLREHPLVKYYVSTGDGRSIRLSDFLTQRQFHDWGLYSEFYRPLNVEHQMTTSIVTGWRQFIGIALSRHRPDFSEKERLMLDLLRPHLVQACRNIQTVDLARRNIEESRREFVVVNRLARVQSFPDQLWQLLARYFSFCRPSGMLPDELNDWLTKERAHLNQESDIPSPPVLLDVCNGNKHLTVRLLWGGKTVEQDVLLFEEKPVEEITTIPTDSRLTPREMEILALVSKGKTNTEISHALALSPRTVKKHLEHIYRKLRVHTRGAAVARFLHL